MRDIAVRSHHVYENSFISFTDLWDSGIVIYNSIDMKFFYSFMSDKAHSIYYSLLLFINFRYFLKHSLVKVNL